MKFEFEDIDVPAKAPAGLPNEPPRITHPSHAHWQNIGVGVHQDVFGKLAWDTCSAKDYPAPMPLPDADQKRRFKSAVRKFRLGFFLRSLKGGRRATHLPGVGARGKVTVVSNPEFPEHEFFQAGRSFPCRIRHANASFVDDRLSVVRSCSVKFADSRWESPLDLLMNSGGTAAFWSVDSFVAFSRGRLDCKPEKGDWQAQKDYVGKSPAALIHAIESLRLGPRSYSDMTYYSKVVFPFHARDGKRRFVKYRILRPDLDKESGFLSEERQMRVWDQSPDADDDRPANYLRNEFKARFSGENDPEYLIQIQLWDWDEQNDTHEVFNCNRWWNEDRSHWIDLAHVRLDEILPDEETEQTRMWLGHQPPGLGVLGAKSLYEYRSLAAMRVLVYPYGQAARRAHMAVLGQPAPFGDRQY